jgi:putative DNA-invertase from lambdoid prophage Rac
MAKKKVRGTVMSFRDEDESPDDKLVRGSVPVDKGTPMRVFGYCRASTMKQAESPETQKGLIAKYCEFMGMPVPKSYYVDPGVSGKVPIGERPAGGVLLGQLKHGDHVVVAKVDRMFRRLSDAATVLDQFERNGIRLHICNLMGGAIDLSSPIGRFLIHILAAFAEMERSFIRERIKDGVARARQKDIRPGLARLGFKKVKAWDKTKNRYVKISVKDDEERAVMGEILKMRLDGMTFKEISDLLTFDRKLKTKHNADWTIMRVWKAFRAELILQAAESSNAYRRPLNEEHFEVAGDADDDVEDEDGCDDEDDSDTYDIEGDDD